jgi:hypothetical protein
MNGDIHVRVCESLKGKFLWATRPDIYAPCCAQRTNAYMLEIMGCSRNLIISFIILSLVGCSSGPIEIVNYSWDCEKKNNTRECKVNYTIKNNDDFFQEATVKIRAHRRRTINDAVSIEVVGEDTLIVKLAPKEQKSLSHSMIVNRRLTQIIVSAYIAK